MKFVIKLGAALILVPLISGFGEAFYRLTLKIVEKYDSYLFFLGGIGAGIISFPLLTRRKFIRTFEHEMTHLIFAKLFFGKVKKLNVTDEQGGFVEYTSYPNPFISLSPYFFPLFSAIVALLIPLLNTGITRYASILIGFFLIQHLFYSISEILASQPDIKEEGRLFSAIFITFFTIFFYGTIISEQVSYNHILIFYRDGFSQSLENLNKCYHFILKSIANLR
jgi:hypothetical protein